MTDDNFYKSITPLEQGIVDFYNKHRGLLVVENAKNILEIGSGWGLFTRSVLMANKDVIVTTIDKIPEPKKFAEHTAGYEDRIIRLVGDSKDFLPRYFKKDSDFDVVFIDGDHSYEGFVFDFKQALRLVKTGGYIICDDVLHRNNFIPEKKYGIIEGLSQFCLQEKLHVEIFPVAHGIALIKINK